jgi:hypothetical protein
MLETLMAVALARVVTIPADGTQGVSIACPVQQATRVVFPEPLHTLKIDARAKRQLGVSVEQASPMGVIVTRPVTDGVEGTLEFVGSTMRVRVRLEATASGSGAEVRLTRERAPATASTEPPLAPSSLPSSPPPSPSPSPPPPPSPSPSPDSPPTARLATPATAGMNELLHAQTVVVDRREGLPGQREMVLVDALCGRASVWLRFVLEGGVGETIDEVRWEQGPLADVVQEASAKDLRIVVALPREGITRRSLVSLRAHSGTVYEFSFSSNAFRAVLKALDR